jgi:hypothetical protein
MNITINPDLTVHVEREGEFFRLSGDPRTRMPFQSEDEARRCAEEIAALNPWMPLSLLDPPAPVPNRTKVSRTEYYGQFTAPEEAMIRIAASEDVTLAKLAAANAAEKQRLMGVAALQVMLRRTDALAPTDTIDLANAQVKEGLGLLVAMSLLTSARKTAIEAGIAA